MVKTDRLLLMRDEKVSKALLILGLPMVISMLVTALYNVVDTYFVSDLGLEQTAAVSVAFPISLIFSGIGLTFGAGAGSNISRLLGQNQKEQAEKVASIALVSSVACGIVIAALMLLFLTPLLNFMGASKTSLDYAKSYALFFILSAIFSTANVTAGNLAVSQGSSHISLTAMITGAVLNMLLDPIFIFLLNMGVKGAAVATLLAQIVTSFIYIWFFRSGKSYIKIKLSNYTFDVIVYKEIIKIGISMFLLQCFAGLSMSLISKKASVYGDEAVAAMGIVLRVVTLGVNIVFGYMKGFQPFAGFNYGAKNFTRLQEGIRCCLKWTTIFCIVWTFIMVSLSVPVLSLFDERSSFLNIAVPALRANTIMFFTFGLQFTYSTLFLAMGKAKEGCFLSICRQGIVFLPVILILPKLLGLAGVFYAQAVADLLTTAITMTFIWGKKKNLFCAI